MSTTVQSHTPSTSTAGTCPFHSSLEATPTSVEALELVEKTRDKCFSGPRIFWAMNQELGVFDPEWSRRINALNYEDVTLPDRFVDVIRNRTSPAVNWNELRTTWTQCLGELSSTTAVTRMKNHMLQLVQAKLNQTIDLNASIQEVTSRALIPIVIDGLPDKDLEKVCADQDYKLKRLLQTKPLPSTFREEWHSIIVQMRSGFAVRRELKRRLKDPQRRFHDMTTPLLTRFNELGMDRAADAVTTVLTAIAGPPGASAIGTVYEYIRHPNHAHRINQELSSLSIEELVNNPKQHAQFSLQFIKETLRLWSPPLFMTRPVRTTMEISGHTVQRGQRYTLSPYLLHHDPESWEQPEHFDPSRWDAENIESSKTRKGAYAPFGWAPKSCIGSKLGTIQLLLWLHLLANDIKVLSSAKSHTIKLAAITLPVNFQGQLTQRQPNAE